MPRSMTTATLFFAALFVGVCFGSVSSAKTAHTESQPSGPSADLRSEAPPPHEPTKKNPGEPCKDAKECQPHHQCVKVGDKNVCQAPPRPQLPPGAVT